LPHLCHRFGNVPERQRTKPFVFNFLGGLKGKVKLPRFHHRYDVTEFKAHRLHLLPLAEILAGL
jgi:hypothetical protein